MTIPIDGENDRKSADLGAALKRSEATRRSLEAENQKLRDALEDDQELITAAAGAISPRESVPVPRFHRGCLVKPEVTAALVVTDTHIGELVKPDEVNGRNAYNWDIASTGAADVVARWLQWVQIQRTGYSIREAAVFDLGDLPDGDLHEDSIRTQEFPVPIQVGRSTDLMTDIIYRPICGAFGAVHAKQVAGGNHARSQHKQPAKQTVETSWEWLIHEFANKLMASQKNFHPETPNDAFPYFQVHGHWFGCTHGDSVKSAGRTPYYGFSRKIGQEIRDLFAARREPVEAFLFGHFHQFAVLEDQDIVLCPSHVGVNQFARRCSLRGKPAMLGFLIGEHGAFGWTRFLRRTGRPA